MPQLPRVSGSQDEDEPQERRMILLPNGPAQRPPMGPAAGAAFLCFLLLALGAFSAKGTARSLSPGAALRKYSADASMEDSDREAIEDMEAMEAMEAHESHEARQKKDHVKRHRDEQVDFQDFSGPLCEGCVPCKNREDCVSIVDEFFETAPKGRIGLYRTYERALAGGECPLCDLSNDYKTLKQRCDIYDNALAAIYLTKRRRFAEAQRILDVFLRLLYPTDMSDLFPEVLYRGASSGRTMALLAASYDCDMDAKGGHYDKPEVLDGSVDSGNNAWVGMAFMHFATATGKGCYALTAAEILQALSTAGSCSDDLGGFMAHQPPKRNNARSLEHNIDIFALAGMLKRWDLQDQAARFVQKMHGRREGFEDAYDLGTSSTQRCDTSRPATGGVPADGQFWSVLADADPDPGRVGKSMSWAAFSDSLWDSDDDRLSGQFPLPRLKGVRFTTEGFGIQFEETAGAAMALAHYLAEHSAGSEPDFKRQLQYRLNISRASLRSVLATYKAVPASVRGGNGIAYEQHNPYQVFPGGSDTGLGFTYHRMIHIASTAWTGLFMLFQTDERDEIWPSANPLTLHAEVLPQPNTFCMPRQEQPDAAITAGSCRER